MEAAVEPRPVSRARALQAFRSRDFRLLWAGQTVSLVGDGAFLIADGFFYPAFGGIVPLVVESHELASANTLIGVSRQGSFVVGPALAGAIYGLAGSPAVFGFDAATFLVSAGLLALARPRAFEPEESSSTWASIVDGARYVASV